MLKNIFIIVSMTTISHLSAMEQQAPLSFFTRMPNDTMDLIATLLTFDDTESEQEFIERTKAIEKKELPQSCRRHLPTRELGINLLHAYCPNERAAILLQSKALPRFSSVEPALAIIDLRENRLLHKEHPSKQSYNSIALSRNAKSFATIHREEDTSGDLCTAVMRYKTIVTIKTVKAQKKEFFNLGELNKEPFSFTHPSIAFNKQETHIIVHYINYNQPRYSSTTNQFSTSSRHHKIILLTVDAQEPNAHKKTLEKYFAQKMICKNFTQQLSLANQ